MKIVAKPTLALLYRDKLKAVPKSVTQKKFSIADLELYFDVFSLKDLHYTLIKYSQAGLLNFKVYISPSYLDFEQAQLNAKFHERYIPEAVDPFGLLRRRQHPLHVDDHKIVSGIPLNDKEIDNALDALPPELAQKFMFFTFQNLDRKELIAIARSNRVSQYHPIKIDNYIAVRYKGLVVDGASASYNGKPINLNRRQAELLRYLIDHNETDVSADDLFDYAEIFKGDKDYDKRPSTAGKLVWELHNILRPYTGECIYNKPGTGWRLQLP